MLNNLNKNVKLKSLQEILEREISLMIQTKV